jgi:hypothetical protein
MMNPTEKNQPSGGTWERTKLQWNGDDRGGLVVVEGLKHVPFEIKRSYFLVGTKEGVRRGFHAHRNLDQVLVAVTGGCSIKVENGKTTETFRLENPTEGLRITNLVWREMFDFTPDCVLLVYASDVYRPSDYIRNYDDFVKEASLR